MGARRWLGEEGRGLELESGRERLVGRLGRVNRSGRQVFGICEEERFGL